MGRAATLLLLFLAGPVPSCGRSGSSSDAGGRDAAPAPRPAPEAPPAPPEAEPGPDAAAGPRGEAGLDGGSGSDAAAEAGAPADPGVTAEAGTAVGPPAVPVENREKGRPPDPSSAEAGARMLLEAIETGDASAAMGFFFPAPAFEALKDLPDPAAYHRRMVSWFREDVRLEREALPPGVELTFDRFQLGRCTWMDVGTEGNLLPYWSCRRNRIDARAGGRPVSLEIRVLINWGPDWYVTHLRPVRR